MQVAISCDERRFSVIFDHRSGELHPYLPSNVDAMHQRFGGRCHFTSDDPFAMHGSIQFDPSALPCSVYNVGTAGLAWHQEPFPQGHMVVVPIDSVRQCLATNEWPVLVRLRGEFWMVRSSEIQGLLRQEAAVLVRARRRNFPALPSIPCNQSGCAALVVGKFPEPIVTSVADALYLLQSRPMLAAD